VISHQEVERAANAHLQAEGSSLVAHHAARNRDYGVWLVAYRDAAEPDVMLDGGGLVVADDDELRDFGSAPGSLDDLMMALGRWPGVERSDVYAREGEGPALLADLDPEETEGLAAWAQERRRERGEGSEARSP
jgi:hypothetical protein